MIKYRVMGMTCASCVSHVEKAVRAVDGVKSVSVNLLTNQMQVEGSTDSSAVIGAVERAGYRAEAITGDTAPVQPIVLADTETPILRKRLLASLLLLLPLLYVSMGHMLWDWKLPAFLQNDHVAMGLFELLLTGGIVVINQRFFISGFTSLLHRAPNMDTLVALGATAAFGYSTYALFAMSGAMAHGDTSGAAVYMEAFYFESAAMILTLITLGKLLEARSKGRTTDAIKALMQLTPQTATLLVNDAEQTVGIETVQPGDLFVVRAGESIPVDGVIVEGASAVDEAALTGESIPIDKTAGDAVSAATISRSGFLTCRATRVGANTTLSQIVRMVSDAAATKAPIAKAADTVSGIFVPVVLGLALLTLGIWLAVGETVGFALARSISVLVISCPCALGLATPVAIMVGSGKGARNGILFKTAASLELTGKTQILALDKTGTLTHGKPVVTDVLPVDDMAMETLLVVAYALEKKSEHPLGHAIVAYGESHAISAATADDFTTAVGHGLLARVDGEQAVGGNAAFVGQHVDIPTAMQTHATILSEQGKTPLYFAWGGRLLGLIAVADAVKENAGTVVAMLRGMGIEVVMLTGDNRRTAEAIGRQIGIQTILSDVLPADKEAQIRRLAQYGRVAMVGDGINDAPALTRADVGIAIGAGTDVALDAADVVLMKSELADIPAAIQLSRCVLRNIHENLFWAFIYNVIGIPLAAGIWIPWFGWQLSPMFGAAAMSLSSFCVVSNALRLNWAKLYYIPQGRRKRKQNRIVIPVQQEEQKMKKEMQITGMMCGHCETAVRKCLEALDGVEQAVVSHESGTAVVTLTADVSDERLRAAVTAQDYTVTAIRQDT